MSSSDLAISIRGLSKKYTISHEEKHSTLAETWLARLRNPFKRASKETFWALKDVSFEVKKGEVVGIIGRNGAGKSTLLKILSRITGPTEGRIEMCGRVGSLLEVGTGFHPELTGRENIFLNGAILGMKRAEIRKHFDEIVAFAEIEKFLDTPVKRYSSGMYMRLAFAVAAHLEPEILIVDEVLAVGDAEFQKKCLGKMKDVSAGGRTVLFVSHNMAAVQGLCTRCVLLCQGQVSFVGAPSDTVERYMETSTGAAHCDGSGVFVFGDRHNSCLPGRVLLRSVSVLGPEDRPVESLAMGQPVAIAIDVQGLSDFRSAQVAVMVRSHSGQLLANYNTGMNPPTRSMRADSATFILRIPRVPFVPGTYWIDLSVAQKSVGRLDFVERAAPLNVVDADVYGSGYAPRAPDGIIYIEGTWEISTGGSEITGSASTMLTSPA
jgi:lipopolysaccharide transport system ATP-binding protein